MFKTVLFSSFCYLSFSAVGDEWNDVFTLSLEELTTIEIATKNKQTIYSSPSIVYVINRQTIQEMGITHLQALLNFVPGFQSTRDIEQGTANRIAARGRSTALSESVLVQIDGNKINDLYTGGISILNRLLDLGHVERIEIIRGPGSALYGSNAFLGVINIITRSGHNEMNVSVSQPSRTSANVAYSHPFGDEHSVDMYVSVFKDQGHEYHLTDIYGITDDVRDPIDGFDAYVKYTLNQWLLTGRFMRRELNDFIPLGSIGNDINQEHTEQWSISGEYQGHFSDTAQYDVLFSHSEDTWETLALLIPRDVELSPGFALDSDFIGGPYLASKNSKVAANVRYQASNDHFLSVGLSFERAQVTDVYTATTHDLFTLEPYPEQVKLTGEDSFNVIKSREIASFYIQDQIQLNPSWDLTAGLRYDHYTDFGHSVSPRLAAVWTPKEKSSVKFMYGTAFRAPNFLELYDRNNYVDFGNVNLNAEEVETIEVSWLHTFDNWHVELTAFNNDFKQLILLDEPVEHPDNPFFSPSFTNNDGQQSRGLEAEMQWRLTSELSMKVLWNWFTDDSDINVAQNSGAVIVDYHQDQWHVNLHSYYRGQSDAVTNQGSYVVSSVNATVALTANLRLNAMIDNMFNQSFRTQSIMYDQGIENRGRTFSLGLTYQF